MFSKKEKYIIRDKVYRSIHIKYRFNTKLQKSLLKNNMTPQTKKLFLTLKTNKTPLKLRKRNLCLISGENNTVKKYFLVSRFALNKASIANKLQNFKINTW